jgi:hypothetical protein
MKATPEPFHSYGHGQFCYYCGIDGDDEVAGAACPQTLRKQPTDEEMAPYRALCKLGEDIGAVAQTLEWGAELDAVEAQIKTLLDEHRRSTSARKEEP